MCVLILKGRYDANQIKPQMQCWLYILYTQLEVQWAYSAL